MALIKPEQLRSGSYNITGSLFGTSSYANFALTASYFSGSISNAINAISASYALTASYALDSNPFKISTGSILASVNVNSTIFLITNNNIPVFTVSQSGIVILSTQSINPSSPAPNGGIYFTSSSLYVGLD